MQSVTPAPTSDAAAEHVDHIPAHVKGSYVNCEQYARQPRLTPTPGRPAGR
ncbi:hypothetical protein F4553_007846 [Allocatelliglobosispora scoriae]|uniref:Uncharacterized protein n=1 Tax=Allocatelliglobosispora scoriae TaxID=643052 RepID=A0A841C5R5_9ACTN|nr:hypothetical protein [Allocatelliglobosispora scoriae]MBB5874412.1 hypothetical protein [Allocatelliglobosispora scoriae]